MNILCEMVGMTLSMQKRVLRRDEIIKDCLDINKKENIWKWLFNMSPVETFE